MHSAHHCRINDTEQQLFRQAELSTGQICKWRLKSAQNTQNSAAALRVFARRSASPVLHVTLCRNANNATALQKTGTGRRTGAVIIASRCASEMGSSVKWRMEDGHK